MKSRSITESIRRTDSATMTTTAVAVKEAGRERVIPAGSKATRGKRPVLLALALDQVSDDMPARRVPARESGLFDEDRKMRFCGKAVSSTAIEIASLRWRDP